MHNDSSKQPEHLQLEGAVKKETKQYFYELNLFYSN